MATSLFSSKVQTYYTGYTSAYYDKAYNSLDLPADSFTLKSIKLVERDLTNHLYTRPTERVMMPTFGTPIRSRTFEQLDETTLTLIESDIATVVNYDPRVELYNTVITPNYNTQSVTVAFTVLYVELNVIGTVTLNIKYD
jgi:phage baseplate assembly protein W